MQNLYEFSLMLRCSETCTCGILDYKKQIVIADYYIFDKEEKVFKFYSDNKLIMTLPELGNISKYDAYKIEDRNGVIESKNEEFINNYNLGITAG